jgi:uncharacterized glyoxalase superfamily protein PhnB
MTDPLDALRQPESPVDPDPTFAAQLRARLERALRLPRGVQSMTATADPAAASATALSRQYALVPYLAVRDARRALDWYVEVFDGRLRGEPITMPDGRIGHAEIAIGGSVLMLADEHPEIDFQGPQTRGGTTVSLHVEVPDVDATVRRAVDAGAELTRPPADEPYGRTGAINDPFGHRWMVQTPPAEPAEPTEPERSAPVEREPVEARTRPGDLGYVTLRTRDDERAKAFFGAVLGWHFQPGRVPRGWQIEGTAPMSGLWGGADEPGAMLTYAVADIDAAVQAIRELGGQASDPQQQPYGRMSDCVDDQGFAFSVWQPAD